MPKAINWPQEYFDEVMQEDSEKIFAAIRPGRLYFDTNYFVDRDALDVRINHKVVRKGVVVGNMQLFLLREIPERIFDQTKSNIMQWSDVLNFLNTYYSEYSGPFDENSEITVVYYKNFPVDLAELTEDPHIR